MQVYQLPALVRANGEVLAKSKLAPMSSTVTWRATCSAPDEVWIPRRLQQLKSEVGEDGRLQELHQSVYLDQHFHSHGQVGVSSDDITSMAVGSC